jgi:WhiB family redox-sensing transcriptional regulator
MSDLFWMKFGACVDLPPAVFFQNDAKKDKIAAQVCQECPVIQECLEYALRHGEYGVWGGTSERQRNKIRVRTYVLGLPVGVSRRKKQRVPEHPVSVSPSLLFGMSVQQKNNQEPVVLVAALPLVFGITYTELVEHQLPVPLVCFAS